jgi:alpha-1,6-mannosyltransferase
LRIEPRKAFLYAMGVGLLLLTLAGLYFQSRQELDSLILILLLEGGLYLAAVYCVGQSGWSGRLVPFILLIAVLLRLGPHLQPPALSTDIYRYVWDGRVQGAGINPYRYVPADPALAPLRDAAIYPSINRAGYARTIYPPAAQMIFFVVTRISERVTAMKLAMLAFDTGTILLILLLLRRGGAPPERVMVYAWHPLTVWEIAGNGHIDSALCFLLALAFLFRRKGMPLATGIALAGGTLIKFFPVLLIPSLYRKWDWRLPAGFVATIALLYLPYLSVGWRVLGFLPNYVAEERFVGGSGFYFLNLFDYLTGQSDPPALAYAAIVVAALGAGAMLVLLRPWPGEYGFAAGSLVMMLLLYTLVTPHHSWYFLWLLPSLCLVPYWPALILTASSFILYATLGLSPPSRDLAVNSLLYGSFLLAVLIHLCVHRLGRPMADPGASSWRATRAK